MTDDAVKIMACNWVVLKKFKSEEECDTEEILAAVR